MAGKAVAKTNGHGGARPNAGRKPGGLGEKARAYAAEAAEEGVRPIDVMLGNMRYYHERAVDFDKKLEAIAETMTAEQIVKGGEEVMNVLKLVAKIGEFRMKAQQCAVDAAPYVHPRLTAIAVKVDNGDSQKPLLTLTEQKTAQQAADAYASMLAGTYRETAV
jgi:hypothetical protein